MVKETRYIKYITPSKIVDSSGLIENLNSLLLPKDDQISIVEDDCFKISGKGYIVLDFGYEIAGGVRILTNMFKDETETFLMRIRFGESVSETYTDIGYKGSSNNHAIRDMVVTSTALSDQSFGDTGFRFIRIDFIDENKVIRIKNIYAKAWFNEFEQIEYFNSNDTLLNKIFSTSQRTIDLCIQEFIWDGIKRDRLVWIGDMEPEARAILHLYGNINQLEKSINFAEAHNPQPCWINGIPSYSMWYLQIISDILDFNNDILFINRHKDYADKIIELLSQSISADGSLDFMLPANIKSNSYFIDWPGSNGTEEEKKDANKNLLIYILRNYIKSLEKMSLNVDKEKEILKKLEKSPTFVPTLSQFAAFHYLVNKDDESYNVLVKNGANGMTTFMSYYILTAIADRNLKLAIDILKEYYGAMLDRGATTFWENFSMEWLKNSSRIDELPKNNQLDLHGDFGEFCYVGFRHSLCHGWSCGPISFLLEHKEKI